MIEFTNTPTNSHKLLQNVETCFHCIAQIKAIDAKGYFTLGIKNQSVMAQLAASCTLQPEEDDIVEVLVTDTQIYILNVLERAQLTPAQHTLTGHVKLGTDESYLDIQSHEISLHAPKASFKTNTLNILSSTSHWVIKKLKSTYHYFNQTSDYTELNSPEFLKVHAKNRETHIDKLDVYESDTRIEKSEQVNLTTNKFNVNGKD